MTIDAGTVDRIARLARLSFSEEEKRAVALQLARMVAFVDRLSEIDTDHAPEAAGMAEPAGVLREDTPGPSLPVEEALRSAPDRVGDYFRVPKVLP